MEGIYVNARKDNFKSFDFRVINTEICFSMVVSTFLELWKTVLLDRTSGNKCQNASTMEGNSVRLPPS